MFKTHRSERERLGLDLSPGAPHYRAYIGHAKNYDLIAAMTFNLLTTIGLRQHHKLIDIGCGSLRIGRLLILYLNVGNYIGVEPHKWLVKEGIKKEVGRDLVRIKKARFFFSDSPTHVASAGLQLDFALAQSIFSHSSVELIAGWLRALAPSLAASGALLATFLLGETDFAGKGWVYPECVKYTEETIRSIASTAGFEFHILDWRHPNQTWGLFAKPEFDTLWFMNRPLTWNTRIDSGLM